MKHCRGVKYRLEFRNKRKQGECEGTQPGCGDQKEGNLVVESVRREWLKNRFKV